MEFWPPAGRPFDVVLVSLVWEQQEDESHQVVDGGSRADDAHADNEADLQPGAEQVAAPLALHTIGAKLMEEKTRMGPAVGATWSVHVETYTFVVGPRQLLQLSQANPSLFAFLMLAACIVLVGSGAPGSHQPSFQPPPPPP